MSKEISQYTAKTLAFIDGDLFDVSKFNGVSAYQTQSFTWAELKAELSSAFGISTITTGYHPYFDGSTFVDSGLKDDAGKTVVVNGSYIQSENGETIVEWGDGTYFEVNTHLVSGGGANLKLDDSQARLYQFGSTRQLLITSVNSYLCHDAVVMFDAPQTIINQATASRAVVFDSSKALVASVTTLAELAYLSGVTSNVQTQLNALQTGSFWKAAVRVATTAAGTLATDYENGDTLDGVVLVTGDRILIKDQATASENGIYVVNASGAPTRATDFDAGADLIAGATMAVNEGTANADTRWTCTTNDPITIGVTSLAFANVGGTTYLAGTGLDLTGNTFSISSTYAGQNTIVTLGTVTTGTWSATAIAANKGGTGQTSYTIGDVLYASSSSALSKLSAGAAGTVLMFGGVGTAPVVSTTVFPNVATANRILYATASDTIGENANLAFNGTALQLGGPTSPTSERRLTILQGTNYLYAGGLVTSTSDGGIWMFTTNTTPTDNNVRFASSGNNTIVNSIASTASVLIQVAGNTRATFTNSTVTFNPSGNTSGAATTFKVTAPSHTNQSASTEVPGANFDLSATLQHATGALTMQRAFLIQAPTYSFVGASVVSDTATLAVPDAPTAGTNATFTRAYAAWLGKTRIDTGIYNDGSGIKHARVTTGSVGAGSTVLVTVTWTTAFADANYTVQASVLDSTTSSLALSVVHIESITASAVTVRVLNNAVGAITGTLHLTAIHD